MSHLYAGLTGVSAALAACATWRGWYDVAFVLATGAVLLGLVAKQADREERVRLALMIVGKETRR